MTAIDTAASCREAVQRIAAGHAPHCARLGASRIFFAPEGGVHAIAHGGEYPAETSHMVDTHSWRRVAELPRAASLCQTRSYTVVVHDGNQLLTAPRAQGSRHVELRPRALAGTAMRVLDCPAHDTVLLTLCIRDPGQTAEQRRVERAQRWEHQWLDLAQWTTLHREPAGSYSTADAWSPSGGFVYLHDCKHGRFAHRILSRSGQEHATLPDDASWHGWLPGDHVHFSTPRGKTSQSHWSADVASPSALLQPTALPVGAGASRLTSSQDGTAHLFTDVNGLHLLSFADDGRWTARGPLASPLAQSPSDELRLSWDAASRPRRLGMLHADGRGWVLDLASEKMGTPRLQLGPRQEVHTLQWMPGTSAWAVILRTAPGDGVTVFRDQAVVLALQGDALRQLSSLPLYAGSGFPNGDPIEHPLTLSPDGRQLLVTRFLGGTYVLDWSRAASRLPPVDRLVNTLAMRLTEACEGTLMRLARSAAA